MDANWEALKTSDDREGREQHKAAISKIPIPDLNKQQLSTYLFISPLKTYHRALLKGFSTYDDPQRLIIERFWEMIIKHGVKRERERERDKEEGGNGKQCQVRGCHMSLDLSITYSLLQTNGHRLKPAF